MFYQVVDTKGKVYAETFRREEAYKKAVELADQKVYTKIQSINGQTAELEKACHQAHATTTAFDSFSDMIHRARTKKEMRPLVIEKFGHKYTVPVTMLTSKGELKKGVKRIVDAYFEAVTAKVQV